MVYTLQQYRRLFHRLWLFGISASNILKLIPILGWFSCSKMLIQRRGGLLGPVGSLQPSCSTGGLGNLAEASLDTQVMAMRFRKGFRKDSHKGTK